jgi:hypothetical protein
MSGEVRDRWRRYICASKASPVIVFSHPWNHFFFSFTDGRQRDFLHCQVACGNSSISIYRFFAILSLISKKTVSRKAIMDTKPKTSRKAARHLNGHTRSTRSWRCVVAGRDIQQNKFIHFCSKSRRKGSGHWKVYVLQKRKLKWLSSIKQSFLLCNFVKVIFSYKWRKSILINGIHIISSNKDPRIRR